MPRPLTLDPDRLLPAEPRTRDIARALYAEVRGRLEISHGADIVEAKPRIYALQFVRRGSSVRLSSIGEIKPTASEGEQVTIQNSEAVR